MLFFNAKKSPGSRPAFPLNGALFFWGILWGSAEAILGYLLHLIPVPGLPGMIMFPIGFCCMISAFRSSGRVAAVLWISWIAAAVKSLDILIPSAVPAAVINPVFAILCEGMAVAGLAYWIKRTNRAESVKRFWPAAFLWRLIYALSLSGLVFMGFPDGVWNTGPAGLLVYFIFIPAIHAAVVYSLGNKLRFPLPGPVIKTGLFSYQGTVLGLSMLVFRVAALCVL